MTALKKMRLFAGLFFIEGEMSCRFADMWISLV